MESLEVSARTVDEAIDSALLQLGLARDEVDIEVLKRGKGGFLGIGAEEARILVTPLERKPDVQEFVQNSTEVLETMLRLMGISGEVEANMTGDEEEDLQDLALILDIKGDDLAILIGRRGQTLASLQHIVRLIVAHRLRGKLDLVIDVDGYKQRRHQSLQTMALRVAQRVAASDQSITLEPMPASERRIIHLALADHEGVLTRSVGELDSRKVIILPKRG